MRISIAFASLMDEVFGEEQLVSLNLSSKTDPAQAEGLATIADYILWYAKDAARV